MATNRYRDSYLNANLTFTDDKITYLCPELNETKEIMMIWEQPIMNKMAEVAVDEGDHVLECGFGMGILSNAVQARNPASHTIVECHPEIIVKLNTWAADKPTVTVVEGNWWGLVDEVKRYDTILMDTYVDGDLHDKFRYFCKQKAKEGGKISRWNFTGGTTDEYMKFYWEDVIFTEVAVDPPENSYYNRTVYHVPLKLGRAIPTSGGFVGTSNTIHINASDTIVLSMTTSSLPTTFLTCADITNPSPTVKEVSFPQRTSMKCRGVMTLNTDLITAVFAQPMVVKRDGVWVEVLMRDVTIGDKLFNVDGSEINVDAINYDESDTVYDIIHPETEDSYFINGILIRKG